MVPVAKPHGTLTSEWITPPRLPIVSDRKRQGEAVRSKNALEPLVRNAQGGAWCTVLPVIILYRYWSGIYHLFDSFGRWYGKEKSGMVKLFD